MYYIYRIHTSDFILILSFYSFIKASVQMTGLALGTVPTSNMEASSELCNLLAVVISCSLVAIILLILPHYRNIGQYLTTMQNKMKICCLIHRQPLSFSVVYGYVYVSNLLRKVSSYFFQCYAVYIVEYTIS